jgi:hypothetical protein
VRIALCAQDSCTSAHPSAAGAAMSATAGGEEVPSEGGAVATPTAQDVLALLREKVPKFQALDPRQRLFQVDLKLELQRHRGGATHLPEQFRRKVPAGHERLSEQELTFQTGIQEVRYLQRLDCGRRPLRGCPSGQLERSGASESPQPPSPWTSPWTGSGHRELSHPAFSQHWLGSDQTVASTATRTAAVQLQGNYADLKITMLLPNPPHLGNSTLVHLHVANLDKGHADSCLARLVQKTLCLGNKELCTWGVRISEPPRILYPPFDSSAVRQYSTVRLPSHEGLSLARIECWLQQCACLQ